MEKYKNLAYSYYNQAINLLEKHKITEAINELKKAVRIYDQDLDILNLLGVCYYYKCDFKKAKKIWKKSSKLKNDNNPAAEYIRLLKSEKIKAFLEEFNHSIELIQKENYNYAAAILSKINKEWDELLEPYLLLSLIYMKRGEYLEAQSLLKEAQELDQSNFRVKEYLIHVQEKLNKNQSTQISKNHLENKKNSVSTKKLVGLKKLAVASIIILLLLGVFYNYQQNIIKLYTDKVLAYNRELNDIQQKTESFREELTEIKNENKFLEEENMALKNNSKKRTENIENLRGQAKDLSSEKESLAAENKNLNYELSRIIFYTEQELFNRAVNLYRENNFSDAKTIFKNIYDSGSADYLQRESLFFLANTELKLNNQKDSVKYFKEYAEEFPTSNYHDDVLYNLGMILNKRGEKEEAKKYLKVLQRKYAQSIYNNQKVNNILE